VATAADKLVTVPPGSSSSAATGSSLSIISSAYSLHAFKSFHAPATALATHQSQIGSAVFSGDRPKDFNFITEAADKNDNIRTPACANVTDEMRNMIPLTPEWTFWPDYDRVGWC
jgi:hypothetical protein